MDNVIGKMQQDTLTQSEALKSVEEMQVDSVLNLDVGQQDKIKVSHLLPEKVLNSKIVHKDKLVFALKNMLINRGQYIIKKIDLNNYEFVRNYRKWVRKK